MPSSATSGMNAQRPPNRFCKTCGTPLASKVIQGPFGLVPVYAHPGSPDHDVVPVAEDDVAPQPPKCDFCSDPRVTTIFPTQAGALSVPMGGRTGFQLREGTVDGHSGWVACGPCASLITRRKARALRDRAVDSMVKMRPGAPRAAIEKMIMTAHGSFQIQRTGEPGRPWPAP